MTALAASRDTSEYSGGAIPELMPYLVKGSTKIYKGGIVVLNAGYAAPGSTATGLITVGVAQFDVDNSSGADGAATVVVKRGIFPFVNSGGDLVVQADIGSNIYITDDQTVCHTATGKSVCGKAFGLHSDGVQVWVGVGV